MKQKYSIPAGVSSSDEDNSQSSSRSDSDSEIWSRKADILILNKGIEKGKESYYDGVKRHNRCDLQFDDQLLKICQLLSYLQQNPILRDFKEIYEITKCFDPFGRGRKLQKIKKKITTHWTMDVLPD